MKPDIIPFNFEPTTRVVFGENTLQRVGELAAELGGRRVLLVTDPGIVAAGHAGRAVAYLEKSNLEVTVFREVEENPTTRHVSAGAAFAHKNGPFDLIIGLGGGSAMDCAKGINFLVTNGGKMEDYWGIGKAGRPMLPSIGIPTTAGTGSEGQSFALISRESDHRKMACGDKKARFRTVILDPALLASVPAEVAAVTAMDALSHALESYVCTRRNAISQLFAREAFRLLTTHVTQFLESPADRTAGGAMLLGAHFAGLAIENSMLGAAHACANPLTANCGMIHGAAVGVMLPHVIDYNAARVAPLYAELALASGLKGDSAIVNIKEKLSAVRKIGNLPETLKQAGVPRKDLPGFAAQAAEQWTGNFNPRPVNRETLLKLYEAAYE